MDDEDLKKPITWQELKDFVNSIDEIHLKDEVLIQFEDETIARKMQEPYKLTDDIYKYDGDPEISGELNDLKQMFIAQGEIFDDRLATIAGKKGTPFLWVD